MGFYSLMLRFVLSHKLSAGVRLFPFGGVLS